MDQMERRAFMKGAAGGALAFTVGGDRSLAHAGGGTGAGCAVPDVDRPRRRPRSRRWARRSFPARAKPASPISSISRSRFRRKRHCSKRASSTFARPIANFYRAAIAAVDNASQALNSGRKFAQLVRGRAARFRRRMRQNKVEGWQGPGGSFVYLLLRSDAVDVVYGTMEGYEALGIPYMPHIAPDKRW